MCQYSHFLLTELGDFKIEGRIINKMKSADDKAIVTKILEELQDKMNRLLDTGKKSNY